MKTIFSLTFILLLGLFSGVIANEDSELMDQVRKGNKKAVEKILNMGGNLHIRDNRGRNLLMLATEKEHVDLVRFFVDRDSSFFQYNKKDHMYLIKACELGNEELIDIFISKGIDPGAALSRNGENCLDIVKNLGYHDLVVKMENLGLRSKEKFNSTYTVPLYIIYIIISIIMTIWVARTLHVNGRVFLVDALKNEKLADSVNHLLVVGFYLINIGFITLALKTNSKPVAMVDSIEILSHKVGMVLVVLGIMHFFNLFMFGRLRRKVSAKQNLQPEST